jgi:conjugative relaxase-like TrwC/TraI family protein
LLSIQPLDAQGRADGAAVMGYLLATEYYVGADGVERCPSTWIGEGAVRLGLSGVVEKDALLALAAGYAPDGAPLVQNAGRPDRKLGYDLTFSADKSVSVLFAAAAPAERDRILAAHHRACDAALEYLRAQVFTRRGHGGNTRLRIGGLVIARFDHFSSRELDIQLHSHHFVANIALGADQKYSTFDQLNFFIHKHAAGALYRSQLARELQGLGYGIHSEREKDADGRETGEVWHRVAGIDHAVLDAFSTRRKQIEAHMREHGTSSQAACLATRRHKDEPTFAEVMSITSQALEAMRAHNPRVFQDAEQLKGLNSKPLRGADRDVLDRLHRYESTWTKADLVETLAKELGGRMAASEILAEADAFLVRNSLVALTPDRHGHARWATQAQIDLERGVVEHAKARQNDLHVRVHPETVERAIAEHEREKGFVLSDEQRTAVRFVASETGGVACVSGWAGSGKTATAGAYIKAFQSAGKTVIGTALSWGAADKLAAETGLVTHSITSLLTRLDKGMLRLDRDTVVLVDEAGLVGARTIAEIQRRCDTVRAKLVLVGDCLQLQPIEASAPFRLVIDATGEAMLTEIRRQRQTRDQELAKLFYRFGHEASGAQLVDTMQANGQLRTERYRPQVLRELVSDYLSDPHAARDKLVIAGTNAQCDALTAAIRAELKQRGQLAGGQMVCVRGKRQRETQTIEVAPGDRVRFGRRDTRLGVANNTGGIVESVVPSPQGGHRLRVQVESDIPAEDGRVVEVATKHYNALAYGYVATVYRVQGQGRPRVYWLAEGKSIDRNLGLVAFTRQQNGIGVYTTRNPDADDDGVRSLARQLDDWRMKQNAIEQIQVVHDGISPAPAIGMGRSFAQRVSTTVRAIVEMIRVRLGQQHTREPEMRTFQT